MDYLYFTLQLLQYSWQCSKPIVPIMCTEYECISNEFFFQIFYEEPMSFKILEIWRPMFLHQRATSLLSYISFLIPTLSSSTFARMSETFHGYRFSFLFIQKTCRVVDPDPDSATLWIRIRIGNPDPGYGSRGTIKV
jgi:hypothetical protein